MTCADLVKEHSLPEPDSLPANQPQPEAVPAAADAGAEITITPHESGEGAGAGASPEQKAAAAKAAGKPLAKGFRAISRTGHTNRGRVRQKSHKSAELVDAGTLR